MAERIKIAVAPSGKLRNEIRPYQLQDGRHPPLGRIQPQHSPFKGMVPVYPNKQGGYSVFTPEQGEIRLRKEFHSHIQAVEVLTATRLLLENAVGKENLERMRLD